MIGFLFAITAMVIATLNGLDRVPPVLLKLARVHRMSRSAEGLRIVLPAAGPYQKTEDNRQDERDRHVGERLHYGLIDFARHQQVQQISRHFGGRQQGEPIDHAETAQGFDRKDAASDHAQSNYGDPVHGCYKSAQGDGCCAIATSN